MKSALGSLKHATVPMIAATGGNRLFFPTGLVFFVGIVFVGVGCGVVTHRQRAWIPARNTHPSATPLLSLFSGYGGLDMGVEQALGPMRPVAVCDIEPGPTTILAAHWDAPNLGDITHVDWQGMPQWRWCAAAARANPCPWRVCAPA